MLHPALALLLAAGSAGAADSLRADGAETAAPEPPAGKLGRAPRSPWVGIRRELAAVRVEKGPAIDGRLDDDVWSLAPDGGPLVQTEPDTGAEPSQRTAFRVLYDDDYLYVGFWCYDSEPEKIVATEMARDGRFSADDFVMIALDTFFDRRNGYDFRVNPNGARGDALITNNVSRNESWDAIWLAAATIDEEGWKAELAIPCKTLSFDPCAATWGFNVFRQIKRIEEQDRWVAARPEIATYNVSEAGNLTGLSGLKQGLGLDVVPYALGRFRHDRAASEDDASGDVGADVRYRITPKITGLLSVNTDFAETEADYRQVNLTRFPLFFPEKRDFFLEDAGIFRFGGLDYQPLPFYSRRIGLSAGGEPVPILVAGKVTGRENGFNIGVLDALMDEHDGLPVRNAFVARVSRNIFEQSSLGGIITYGDPNSREENLLGGADFGYRRTDLFGDQVLESNLWGLGTYTEGAANENSAAFGGDVSYPNDLYAGKLEFVQIGKDFHPALGFTPRRDVRGYMAYLRYSPRPSWIEAVRQVFFTYSGSVYTDLSNELDTAYQSLYPVSIEFESGDRFSLSAHAQFDAPDEDFEIHPGVIIPSGEYWWTYGRAGLETGSKRRWELELSGTYGTFYDGERQSCYARVDVKPWKHLTFRASYSLNRIELPAGDFDTHLVTLQAKVAFRPDMIWHHLLQYDDVSESVGYNTRFVWEVRPGTYLYIVFNQTVAEERSRFEWIRSEVIGKIAVTFRF
ncbi:MAG: DUF5916 domain-containing protein [Planctomycetota bacterium]